MRIDNSTEFLKYDFTEEETKDMSQLLARKLQEEVSTEAKKKQVVKTIDGELATIQKVIGDLAEKIRNGHEYRDVKCKITFDYEKKVKRFERLDNGEIFKETQMTEEDLQMSLEDIPEKSGAEGSEEQTEKTPETVEA